MSKHTSQDIAFSRYSSHAFGTSEDEPTRHHARTCADALRAQFAQHADPARAEGESAYLKTTERLHGIRVPVLRKIVNDHLTSLLATPPASFAADPTRLFIPTACELIFHPQSRDDKKAGIFILGHRYAPLHWPAHAPLFRDVILATQWWDLVDSLQQAVRRFSAAKLAPVMVPSNGGGAAAQVPAPWSDDENMWVRRFAIISQLGFKDRTSTAMLTKAIDGNMLGSLHGDDFFIRKAIGWSLREYAKTSPQWVRDFVSSRAHILAPLSIREALRNLEE